MPKSIESKIMDADRDGSIMDKITNKYTHVDIHTKDNLKSDLDRILYEEKKTASSHFVQDPNEPDMSPQERADMFIQENLIYSAGNISEWMETAQEGDKKAFRATFDPEDYGPVGSGLIMNFENNSVREYNTDAMRIVLRKSEKAPLGFSLVTAYPDMSSDHITPTGKDLSEIVKQTEAYKNADSVGRTYLQYITNPANNELVTYKNGGMVKKPNGEMVNDSMMMMRIQTPHPNHYHEIKIKEHAMTLRTITNEPDQYGYLSKKAIQTPYTQAYAKMKNFDDTKTTKVSLTANKVWNMFSRDYPDIATQLSSIRDEMRSSKKEFFNQQEQRQQSSKQNRGQMAETKFGDISQNQTPATEQQFE